MRERRALALVVALGAGLRVLHLGGESFWGDELAMALVTGRGWDAVREELLRGRAPVFVLLGHLWMQAFGTSEAAARSLSAVAGILSLPLLHLVGRRLVGAGTALLGVLLMAVSGFQVAYAQEYRYYALVVLLTLTLMLFYLKFLEEGRGADLLAWSLSAGLLYHTHPYGLLVVAAQDVHFALAARGRASLRRSWLGGHLLLALIMLPGLVLRGLGAFAGYQRIPSWITPPAPWQPALTLAHFLLPRGTRPAVLAAGAGLLLAGMAVRAASLGVRRWRAALRDVPGRVRPAAGSHLALLLLWLALPLLLPLAVSWVFAPIYVDRYLIAASPAAYLLAALGLQAIRELAPLPLALSALLLVVAPGLRAYYATPQKEQWREATAYLRSAAGPGDVVVFMEPRTRAQSRALGWYGTAPARPCSVDREIADGRRLWETFVACVPASGRAWIFERTPATPQQAWLHDWIDGPSPGLRPLAARRFQGITLHHVRLLDRPAPPS